MNNNYLKLTTNIGKKRKKKLALLPIDVIQRIGLLTNSTSAYLNLALCCKQNSKILQKPKRWRAIKRFTIISNKTPFNSTECRLINGRLHREDGPARIYADGDKEWYVNGLLHRENGPAITQADGYKAWYINDKLHREDGPAVINVYGSNFWYINGERHREDGPAIIRADGSKAWYIKGVKITEEAFNKIIA